MKDVSHEKAMVEEFRNNPEFAIQCLNEAFSVNDKVDILIALRQYIKANGGIKKIHEETDINLLHIYAMLDSTGNPRLKHFLAILKSLGLRLTIEPIDGEKQ